MVGKFFIIKRFCQISYLAFQTWLANQHFTAGLVVNGTTDVLQTINIKGDGTAVPHEETFEEFYAKTDAFEASGDLFVNPLL